MGFSLPTSEHWENLLSWHFHAPKRSRGHLPPRELWRQDPTLGTRPPFLLIPPTRHQRNLGCLCKKPGQRQKPRQRCEKLWTSNSKAFELEEIRPIQLGSKAWKRR